jgi:transmembrane sensor
LARYLAGDADAGERADVEAWASATDANRAELERLRAAWHARPTPARWDVDRAWQRVSASMDAEADIRAMPPRARRSWTAGPLVRLAAALLAIAGGMFAWKAFAPQPAGEPLVFATTIGEQRRVDLNDGTVVTLSPASELRVDAAYGTRGRRVDLTGEAWFEVVHDEARAFEVHAGGTVTRDLGTSFSVRALPGDTAVRVVVVEGAASLRRSGAAVSDGVALNARDVGTLGTGAVRVDHGLDVGALTAWRTGYLEFNDATLDDVAAELQRWHPVTVRFSDSTLRARRVTAPLRASDLTESIEILSRVLGIRVEQVGDPIVIR